MLPLLCSTVYYFCMTLEILLLLYLFLLFFPSLYRLRMMLSILVLPLLVPATWLLKHSILYCREVDFSPVLAVLVLGYIQSLLPQMS